MVFSVNSEPIPMTFYTHYCPVTFISPSTHNPWQTGGGGADFSKNYTHQSWHLYAQEGSGGACSPGKFWKLTPQMTHSRPYFGRNMVVCVFLGPWTGRGKRAGCAPSGYATVDPQPFDPQPPRPTTSLKNLLDPEKLKIGELYVQSI